MARPIFISYRRADSLATSGRLRDRLAAEFGAKRVFIDVDDIPHGRDFVLELERQVATCSVLLVIIAPGWLDARDERGNRRLENPQDFARIEVRAALSRKKIAVIPVLVDGAEMPSPEDLPDDLKPLARRHAIELRNAYFGPDADRLIRSIRQELKESRPISAGQIVVGLSLVLAIAAGAVAIWTVLDQRQSGIANQVARDTEAKRESVAARPVSGVVEVRSVEQAATASGAEAKSGQEDKSTKSDGAGSPQLVLQSDDRRSQSDAQDTGRSRPGDAPPSAQPTGSVTPPDLESTAAITDPGLLREIRSRLYELNFDPGPLDGGKIELMEGAIREFEAQTHWPQTGAPTVRLLHRLRAVPQPRPWGAIVYARASNKWGMAWGHQTRAEAIANARSSCGDQAKQCVVEVSFFGGECAAFAHSDKGWAITARESTQRAREAALADCRKQGEACTVIAAVCADGAQR